MVDGLLPFLQQEFGSAALEFGELRGKEGSRVFVEVTDFGKNIREIMRFKMICGHMRNFIGNQILQVFKNRKQKQRKLM
ncbi:hypothetical protein Y032_0106g3757 [Ancylostoma ceylanicum]|uniref:Uncharacterized protein n=1 Tax=Ancylostoma ceylanicum TaxID=53326 RepID=A0A016TF66_9BILA|nr:hypothetical protein Y032_0106g3757 [Ancylostoma ceylanicum]